VANVSHELRSPLTSCRAGAGYSGRTIPKNQQIILGVVQGPDKTLELPDQRPSGSSQSNRQTGLQYRKDDINELIRLCLIPSKQEIRKEHRWKWTSRTKGSS
jgi:hypothetical protein